MQHRLALIVLVSMLTLASVAAMPLAPRGAGDSVAGADVLSPIISDPAALEAPQSVILGPDGTVYDAKAFAPEDDGPVIPDPGFIEQIPSGSCTPENEYEQRLYQTEDPLYGDDCKRISFAWGPILVKPGQNDVLLEPATIEMPRYNGYIVRFKPDLVRSLDGSKPYTEELHLHHATWLNLRRDYGDGPFFAAGEEKTINTLPTGYGIRVQGDDEWGLLHMVHNAIATPEAVWIRYDIDFVPEAVAEDVHGIVNVKPLWLDVQKGRVHPDAPSTSSYPVFNAQRGYGSVDEETNVMMCTWPDENCAMHDAFMDVTPNQGLDYEDEIDGYDWTVSEEMAGTIVGLGGHLHPGGIRDEVSLVRDGVEKPIFWSDALYWDHEDPTKVGGEPTSWNMSMTVTGTTIGWKVKIKQGDVVRINTVTDTFIGSVYEGMGIVVAYVVPEDEDPHAPAGLDVFDDDVVIEKGISSLAVVPEGSYHYTGFRPGSCDPDLIGDENGVKTLCLRGMPTHGQSVESGNTGGCTPDTCPEVPGLDVEGPLVTDIFSVGFTYGRADFGVVGLNGIPRVTIDEPVRLWNLDADVRVWHTYTRCAMPCTGSTKVNYPTPDGGTGKGDVMNFDSGNIGWGLLFEPTTSRFGAEDPYDETFVQRSQYIEFTPDTTGTFTFFCRIHPGMRGVFEVVE